MHKNQTGNFAVTKRQKREKRTRKSPKRAKPGAFWVLEGVGTVENRGERMGKTGKLGGNRGTDLSRLPPRVLLPSGERPAPTEAAAETGSQQSATGARSPHDTHCAGRSRALLPRHSATLTKNGEVSARLTSPFLAGAEGLVSAAASVSSQQSATGARSPLGTRFWSGCGGTQQAVGEGQGCAVLTEKSRKDGADLVLREVFLLFSKKNNKSLSSLNFNNEQPS